MADVFVGLEALKVFCPAHGRVLVIFIDRGMLR